MRKHWHINLKELHVPLSMIHSMPSLITNKTVVIYIDNRTAVQAIHRLMDECGVANSQQ